MQKKVPNFLVCGPPKCASTSLNFYLKQHPEIYMSPEKQTRFFSVYYDKGIQFYLDTYFSGITTEKMAGEATPTYSLLPFVVPRIKAFNPDMKLVFCLRNPVERTFSGWSMRANNGTEHLSFRDAVAENLKQRQTVKFDNEKDAAGWADDMKRGDRLEETGYRTYLDGSFYASNIRHFLEHFPMQQIKVVYMENLIKDLQGTLQEIYRFLGVDDTYVIEKTEQKNTYKKSKIKFLEPILGKNKPLSKLLAGIMPKGVKKKILDTMYVEGSKKKLTPEDRKFTYEILKDDINDLEKLLNVDLSHWKVK